MYSITGTAINLTRGDTFTSYVTITYENGSSYTPVEGDVVTFSMKKSYFDEEPLIEKIIPNDTLTLTLESSDTEGLSIGHYVYDIDIVFAEDGAKDTFISGSLNLMPEV